MRTLSALVALIALALVPAAYAQQASGDALPAERDEAAEQAAEDDALMWVAYEGELLDGRSRPISGVFPFTLELYRSAAATEPIWVEVQHVAVSEGRYRIFLGRTRGVPEVWSGQERVLAITLGDAGEIARHPITLTPWADLHEASQPTVREAGVTELAGRAISAERASFARECMALDGRTAEELDRFDALMERVGELRTRLNASGSSRIGRDTQTQPRIGSENGVRYQRTCPPGFVATGARGGGGNIVDGLRLVCTELR